MTCHLFADEGNIARSKAHHGFVCLNIDVLTILENGKGFEVGVMYEYLTWCTLTEEIAAASLRIVCMNQFDESVAIRCNKSDITSVLGYINAEALHHWVKLGIGYELTGMREYIAEGCHRKGDMNISMSRLLRTREKLCAEINQTDVTFLYLLAIARAILDIHVAVLILREIDGNHTIRERRK